VLLFLLPSLLFASSCSMSRRGPAQALAQQHRSRAHVWLRRTRSVMHMFNTVAPAAICRSRAERTPRRHTPQGRVGNHRVQQARQNVFTECTFHELTLSYKRASTIQRVRRGHVCASFLVPLYSRAHSYVDPASFPRDTSVFRNIPISSHQEHVCRGQAVSPAAGTLTM
jgi:hypothetical protein